MSEQIRRQLIREAVHRVDRERTTRQISPREQLWQPLPEDQFLKLDAQRRVRESSAMLVDIAAHLAFVEETAQEEREFYEALMPYLTRGMTECEALEAYQADHNTAIEEFGRGR